MYKIIPPGSFDFGEKLAERIKIAHDGLRGNDLKAFMKRAGHEVAERVRTMTFHPGEVPIHLLAMGALESTGGNRNADSWKAATLKAEHKTFEKYARFYRDHQSHNPARSYGRVPFSYYNDQMKRIELVVALNGTKEAANRNGGLIADRELDLLEKNAEIPVSMAVNCAYDVCSSCGNRARTRREYCTGPQCKHGGLKKNAGKVFQDGHRLTAITYGNKWRDISHVERPADATAYVFGKAAAAVDRIICGAELAEMFKLADPLDAITIDDIVFPGGAANLVPRIKAARDLTSVFGEIISNRPSIGFCEPITGLGKWATDNVALVLKAFTQEKVALTLPEWLELGTGLDMPQCYKVAAEIRPYLANELNVLAEDSDLPDLLRTSVAPLDEPTVQMRKLAFRTRATRALDPDLFRRRVWLSEFRGLADTSSMSKSASSPPQAIQSIAQHYLAYQVEVAHALSTRVDGDALQYNLARQLCS